MLAINFMLLQGVFTEFNHSLRALILDRLLAAFFSLVTSGWLQWD